MSSKKAKKVINSNTDPNKNNNTTDNNNTNTNTTNNTNNNQEKENSNEQKNYTSEKRNSSEDSEFTTEYTQLFQELRKTGSSEPTLQKYSHLLEKDFDKIPNHKKNFHGSDVWPYRVIQTGSEVLGQDSKELIMEGINPDINNAETYCGRYARNLIESKSVRPNDSTWIGYTTDPIKGITECGIPHESLERHMALFGKTGFGKSTVLQNLILQWVHGGYGLAFIDPKGDDAEDILRKIPEHRLDDVIWIEPYGEETYEMNQTIGLNIFEPSLEKDDDNYSLEVKQLVNDFISALKSGQTGWGSRIEGVSKTVSRLLIEADQEFTVTDMLSILSDEEERKYFVENFGKNTSDQTALNNLKNFDQETLEPTTRRLREWTSGTKRHVLSSRDTNLDLKQAVLDGKILIIKTSNLPGEKLMSLTATIFVSRIWSIIEERASNTEENERDYFFLVGDEFDDVIHSEMEFEKMLKKARSYKLSLGIAAQYPAQLPGEAKEAIFTQCENIFSFNPGQSSDTRDIVRPYPSVSQEDIVNLPKYELIGNFEIKGTSSPAININTLPPYPPIRTPEEAKKVKTKSLEKYGTEMKNEEDEYNGVIKRHTKNKNNNDNTEKEEKESYKIGKNNEIITKKQILESTYTASKRHETKTVNGKEWVHQDKLTKELQKYADTDLKKNTEISNILTEKIPETELERSFIKGSVFFRLTKQGQSKAFEQNTGKGRTGGKEAHRILIKKAIKIFTKMGYIVKAPTQEEGAELPDIIAEPPIKPAKGNDIEEITKLTNKLKEEYPQVWELSKDKEINIEAEYKSKSKPKQTIKNLVKGLENNKKIIFIVQDGTEKTGKFEGIAEKLDKILRDPPYAKKETDKGKLYYTSGKLVLSDGTKAVKKEPTEKSQAPSSNWWKRDNKLILESNRGNGKKETIAEIELTENLENSNYNPLRKPNYKNFEYRYKRNPETGKIQILDKNDRIVEESEKRIQDLDGWGVIRKPYLPETVLPEEYSANEPPSYEDVKTIITPDYGSDKKPSIYKNGKLKPLVDINISEENSHTDTNKTNNNTTKNNNNTNNNNNTTTENNNTNNNTDNTTKKQDKEKNNNMGSMYPDKDFF